MAAKPRPKRQPETYLKVSSARIRQLVKAAAELTVKRSHIGAFLLLWTAHEALIYRACVKALWIRGYKVTDAEKDISSRNLEGHKLWDFFCRCCGGDQNTPPFGKTDPYIVLRNALLGISTTRNSVVHGARIAGQAGNKTLIKANTIITAIINNSAKAFGDAKVRTEAQGDKLLGDPLDDLRKWKRKSYVPKEKLSTSDSIFRVPPPPLVITRLVATALTTIDPSSTLPIEEEKVISVSLLSSRTRSSRYPSRSFKVEYKRTGKLSHKSEPQQA
jgi:hypothetical protein